MICIEKIFGSVLSFRSGQLANLRLSWVVKDLIKVGAHDSYRARRLYVHMASAFPGAHHY
jgi:hypothetical protein